MSSVRKARAKGDLWLANWVFGSHKSCPVAEHDAEESDWLFEFWAWLDTHRLKAAIIFGVMIMAGFYFYINSYNLQQDREDAEAGLAETNRFNQIDLMRQAQDSLKPGFSGGIPKVSPESFKAIYDGYPDTPAGIRARLLYAKALFNAGRIVDTDGEPGAQTIFSQFITDHEDHPLIPIARLGKAVCLDINGDFDAATKEYDAIIGNHKGTQAALYAKINKAAGLAKNPDQVKKAKELLDEILEDDTDFFMERIAGSMGMFGGGQSQLHSTAGQTALGLRGKLLEDHPELVESPLLPNTNGGDGGEVVNIGNGTQPENNATEPTGNASTPEKSPVKPEGNKTSPDANSTKPEGNSTNSKAKVKP